MPHNESSAPDSAAFSRFESELQVRPSDVDMNRHVHSSHYMDYVLAARYDQMERCYGMAMDAFIERGFGWVVRTAHMEFKRPLGLGDHFIVGTRVTRIARSNVTVAFDILRLPIRDVSCRGWFLYTMVQLDTGKPATLPEDILRHYSI